ncbi:unnamed protein product, partial [Angiostrongylus costaricensis]|uniref:Tyrosine-protein phosphatase domain-containing protein n=1 Tax=Angiostrongylus costaricensis TaxID=334426 RepID=A0A0R3PMM1_ANGCS
VICNELTRVSIKDGKGSDYIHANYVKGDYLQNTFICTQGPMPTTVYDFWRMILSENVTHIVMLCETIENGKAKCEQYWPIAKDEKMTIEGNAETMYGADISIYMTL